MRLILCTLNFKGEVMKKNIKRILSIFLLIMIVFGIMSYTQVRFDHNNVRIEGFYREEANSLDVLFIGASEVYSDYSPVYAYEKYGFTSYNYSIEDNPLMLYKWELDEIYSHQKPKAVIIEITAATSDRTLSCEDSYFDATLRKISDSVPISLSKFELVNQFGQKKHQISYFCPSVMYHGSLPKIDVAKEIIGFQSRGYSYLKGAVTRTNSLPCQREDLYDIHNDSTMLAISKTQEQLLIDLLEHCRNKGYNVVFARFPHRVESKEKYDRYCEGNYVSNIIEQYGFEFLDFEHKTDEIGIDKITDFADGEHLRMSGSLKFTEYVGALLFDKCVINKTELSKSNREKWNNCVKYIDSFKKYYEIVKDGSGDRFISEKNELLEELQTLM